MTIAATDSIFKSFPCFAKVVSEYLLIFGHFYWLVNTVLIP